MCSSDLLDDEYKKYCFTHPEVRRQIVSRSTYTTRALTNGRSLSAVNIPLPPLPEQRAIAAALSDADALITSLETLIAKKRAIKQAAMQQLLTGRMRLPGFAKSSGYKNSEVGVIPKDWRSASIPDVVMQVSDAIKIGPFGSSLKKEYLTKDGYKVYGQENVFTNDMTVGDRYIDTARFKQLRSCEVLSGDFLISMMGTVGKCIVVPEALEPGIMDSHLLDRKSVV